LSASRWTLAAALIALLVLVPVGVVLASLWTPQTEVWGHLVEYVLPDLLINTLWLVLGVGAGVAVLGVSLAWLTAMCEFPGRRVLSWALLLPLAIPGYVLGFVFIGLFDFTGPVQSLLRETFGMINFPPVRSRGGVILVMTLTLYPYVYLIARNAFLTQGRRALEVAQSLGLSQRAAFYRVALPMARPWIAGGVMLAVMETLADFGTVAVFNYDTFTTGIYKAWYGLFSLSAASQLASLLVVLVFAIVLVEQYTRSRKSYTATGRHAAPRDRILLRGMQRWGAAIYGSAIVAFAFVIPLIQLGTWAREVYVADLDARYFEFLWHSLLLGGLAAVITAVVALTLSYSTRHRPSTGTRWLTRIATLGYTLPGPVLAVGTFIPIAWLDQHLGLWLQRGLHIDAHNLLQGTLLTMLVAYTVRFLAVSYNPIDGNMQRITRSVDDAARSLGVSGIAMLARVHVPILRGGLITGMLLVFVDVMKEMPITLMTRPFGWDTLAIRIFEMTSEGQWERAALPSVALVVAGLVPIALLTRYTELRC
jgi:iron(III) transport system permease protein